MTKRVRLLLGASVALTLLSMGMILIFGERYPVVIWGGLALIGVAFVAFMYCVGAAFGDVQSPSRGRGRDRSQGHDDSATEPPPVVLGWWRGSRDRKSVV